MVYINWANLVILLSYITILKVSIKIKKSLKISFVAFIVSIMVTLFLAIDVGEKAAKI